MAAGAAPVSCSASAGASSCSWLVRSRSIAPSRLAGETRKTRFDGTTPQSARGSNRVSQRRAAASSARARASNDVTEPDDCAQAQSAIEAMRAAMRSCPNFILLSAVAILMGKLSECNSTSSSTKSAGGRIVHGLSESLNPSSWTCGARPGPRGKRCALRSPGSRMTVALDLQSSQRAPTSGGRRCAFFFHSSRSAR